MVAPSDGAASGPVLYVSFSREASRGVSAGKLLKQARVPIAKQLDQYVGQGAARNASVYFQLLDVRRQRPEPRPSLTLEWTRARVPRGAGRRA